MGSHEKGPCRRQGPFFVAADDESSFEFTKKYIDELVGVVDSEKLGMFSKTLNETTRALEEAGMVANEIPIRVFREWASEVESFSFNWRAN